MRGLLVSLTVVASILMPVIAHAEVEEVLISRQFGMPYLPMVLMQKHELIEKHAAERNINLRAQWLTISATSANESLISGAVDIIATGTGPLILLWDRTKSNMGVKAIAAVSDMPMRLNSRNPNFKTLADLSSEDRIAVPAIGLGSMQAITLKKAATDLYGAERNNHFDANIVAMPHPDATAALLSGMHEINSHFTTPPYMYLQLENDAVHTVMSSFDVWGQSTLITLNTTSKFVDDNPTVAEVILAALQEAQDMATADLASAIKDYVEVTGEQLSPSTIEAFLNDDEVSFNLAPSGMLAVATFMHEIGGISEPPADWKEMFHEGVHDLNGS